MTVIVVGWWFLNDLGRGLNLYFGDGLLGPEDQRQRVETTHGFAISMAGDWTAEDPSPDPEAAARSGMRALLTMRPREEKALCSVYLAAGAVPLLAWEYEELDTDLLGERLIGPWLAERGVRVEEWGETYGGPMGQHTAGLSFGDDTGFAVAAWVFPHPRPDDLFVLACTWTPGAKEESGPEWWGDHDMLRVAMAPMVRSFESLPEES